MTQLDLVPLASSPADDLAARRRDRLTRIAPRGGREFTALERAEMFVDPGTFVAISPMRKPPGEDPVRHGCGVVVGWGLVNGTPVVIASHDAAIASGAIGAVFAENVMRGQRLAIDKGYPIVYINDSGGARIHDGIEALHGCGGIFALNIEASHSVPQISLILGPCAGAAAYSPALTDWTIMVKEQGQMFLTGPEIVKAATGEDAHPDDIGGSRLHTKESGVAHLEVDTETAAFDAARHLLSFVPAVAGEKRPSAEPVATNPIAEYALPRLVPESASVVFDMRALLDGVLDDTPTLELMPTFGTSVVTLLGRLDGRPVGVVASQPQSRGGILDSKSSVKAARFVEFCGRFGLPILTFVDVPGFLPGTVEEKRGVITHGAKLLRAYVEAKTPKLTVIVRKAYGGAYIAMGARSLGADFTWAWPGSEIAVMGPGGAVALLHRRALKAADDPTTLRNELAADYRENVARPYIAAEAGIIDDVILPEETRGRLADALLLLSDRS